MLLRFANADASTASEIKQSATKQLRGQPRVYPRNGQNQRIHLWLAPSLTGKAVRRQLTLTCLIYTMWGSLAEIVQHPERIDARQTDP